jgi:hypothetical protein
MYAIKLVTAVLLIGGAEAAAQRFSFEWVASATRGGELVLRNSGPGVVTAIAVQPTFYNQRLRQKDSWGGFWRDELLVLIASGDHVIKPGDQKRLAVGRPPVADPLKDVDYSEWGVLFDDGTAEGNESIIREMRAGRRQALVELTRALPVLNSLSAVENTSAEAYLSEIRKLRSETAALPGKFFPNASPVFESVRVNMQGGMRSNGSPLPPREVAIQLIATFEMWKKRLEAAVP